MIEHLGFLAPCTFILLWALSALSDREWKLGINYLSDLGVSKRKAAAIAFNGGCMICGAMFFLYSVWMVSTADDLLTVATFAVGAVMSVFFSLIGAINENKRPYHVYTAYSMFSAAMLFLVLLMCADAVNGRYLLLAITLAGFISVPLSFKVGIGSMPIAETVGAIAIAAVFIVHFA